MALLAAVALADAPAATAFDTHYAAAELFARRQWWPDARDEVRAALQTPEGAQSYEAHWLAARVAWELLDVVEATRMAREAARLAPDPGVAADAAAYADALERDFGFLDVIAPYPGMVSRLQLEFTGTFFDPELKQYVNRAALRLRDRTPLPVRMGLPAGPYLVNGVAVTVPVGGDATAALPLKAVGARGLAGLQVARLELSVGVGALTGVDVSNLYPAALATAAWTQPIGPLLIGATVGGGPQSFTRADHAVETWTAWSVGGRVGTEAVLGGPLSLRPSATLRAAAVPGVSLACTTAADGWDCGGEPPPELPIHRIYTTGMAVVPGAEVLLEAREAGRTTAIGTGVKVAIDGYLGSVPASGEADDGEQTWAWSARERRWSALGLSMAANIAIAF